MHYLALASDYDKTLATEGVLPDAVVAALRQLRASGRKLILVTGRELPDLLNVCPHVDLFDRVVAENGALLYRPGDRTQMLLAEPFPPRFLEALRARGVPVSVGQSILATVQPHEDVVLECIREQGLQLQVIMNREAVMILPSGVNKASGLKVALRELQLSSRNLVAVGDGENDHAFIDVCECAVAVANAVPSLREQADFVTTKPVGAGVIQVIEAMLRDDFAIAEEKLVRHRIELGRTADGRTLNIPKYGSNVLIAGEGPHHSTFLTGLLARVAARGYGYCIVDADGNYQQFAGAINVGSAQQAPLVEDVAARLEDPAASLSINLAGVSSEKKPAVFRELLSVLSGLRTRIGRPHWLVVDAAEQVLSQPIHDPAATRGTILVTGHPEQLPGAVLQEMNVIVALGSTARSVIERIATAADLTAPPAPADSRATALAWLRSEGEEVVAFDFHPEVRRAKAASA